MYSPRKQNFTTSAAYEVVQLPPLLVNSSPMNWQYFKLKLLEYLYSSELEWHDDRRQKCMLKMLIGREVNDMLDEVSEPTDTFEECLTHLDKHFGGSSSTLLRRKLFYSAKQRLKETPTKFALRLQRLADDCGFGTSREFLLRDIFIFGLSDHLVGEKLLCEDPKQLTLEVAVQKAEIYSYTTRPSVKSMYSAPKQKSRSSSAKKDTFKLTFVKRTKTT